MEEGRSHKRVVLLTNVLAPYRLPVYQHLARIFELRVLVSGEEDNRRWETHAAGLTVRKAWGFTFKRVVRSADGKTVDLQYTHVNPGYFWELLRYRPDAIVSNEMGFRSLVALLVGVLFRIPVWIWWGGTVHTERSRSKLRRGLRALFVRANCRWISYGQTSTEYLLSIGVKAERILQIQNCVDEQRFRPDGDRYPLDIAGPRALVVGQLIERKGIYPLLEAVSRVQSGGVHLSLIVVGDGPEREAFLERARQLGVQNLIHIPHCSQAVLPSVYRSCDFLIFPTLEDVWGLVANEALLCGLPVLSSIYAGCTPEIIPPENRFDPLDMHQFTEKLRGAVDGKIAPPDLSMLKTSKEVAEMIAQDIISRLGKEQ